MEKRTETKLKRRLERIPMEWARIMTDSGTTFKPPALGAGTE